jgi:hypothetical protein
MLLDLLLHLGQAWQECHACTPKNGLDSANPMHRGSNILKLFFFNQIILVQFDTPTCL